MLIRKYLLSIALLCGFLAPALATPSLAAAGSLQAPIWRGPSAAKPDNLKAIEGYSNNLELISQVAFEFWNVSEISIGGGTARSLIQAVTNGSTFQFRDFDIVLSTNRPLTAMDAQKFGEELERRGLGDLSLENLRPRPRYNPELPKSEAFKYNAGFGFFIMDPLNIEYDITLFHSPKDMELNGIMDVDCFRVVLQKGQTLRQLLRNPTLFQKAIRDPYGALEKITTGKGRPQVAKWGELERDPGNVAIRVIRSLGKFNALPLDVVTQKRIQNIFESQTHIPPLQMARNLLKLFQDPNWILEFDAVVKTGAFAKQFKSFSKIQLSDSQKNLPVEERIEYFLKQASKEDGLNFLKTLSAVEPKTIQNQLPKFIQNKKLKVGYFTGEFAPFHKGHYSVVETALEKGGLDLIFVLPAPHVTNDPKVASFSPKEYSERIGFVQAGLKNDFRAWVWPSFVEGENQLAPKLDQALKSLESFVKPTQALTHVFGMDSFHRVVHRDLLQKDPRPRIVVTRPGVPVPEIDDNPNVKILENIRSEPVSATRILHALAVSGKSSDLAPEVQELVLKTARYQKIMQKMQEGRNEAITYLAPFESLKGKTVIWDPRENNAGLYDPNAPDFSDRHKKVLNELAAMGAENVIIYMPDDEAARPTWTKERRKFYPMRVQVSQDYAHVPANQRVVVQHSGVINEALKKGYFAESFRGEKGLIVFETPDQPLSPLIASIQGLKVISTGPEKLSCNFVHATRKTQKASNF